MTRRRREQSDSPDEFAALLEKALTASSDPVAAVRDKADKNTSSDEREIRGLSEHLDEYAALLKAISDHAMRNLHQYGERALDVMVSRFGYDITGHNHLTDPMPPREEWDQLPSRSLDDDEFAAARKRFHFSTPPSLWDVFERDVFRIADEYDIPVEEAYDYYCFVWWRHTAAEQDRLHFLALAELLERDGQRVEFKASMETPAPLQESCRDDFQLDVERRRLTKWNKE